MTTPLFIHLRVHTAYSLSEGAVRMGELVKLAKAHNMPAVGMADSNNLFGALEFSKAMAGEGIQPILGCVLNLKPEEKPTGNQQVVPDKLVLYVQNELGYRNLLALVSESYLHPVEEPAPLLTLASLRGRTEGLLALMG